MMSCLLRNPDCLSVAPPEGMRLGARALVGFLLLMFWLPGGGGARAQEAPGELSEASGKAADGDAQARIREAALAEVLQDSAELAAAQAANFQKWIPHTYPRLKKRQPVHIVVIGDSVTRYMSYDGHEGDSHYAYHGVFAAHLADEFFYTGGVRDILPLRGNPAKVEALLGPEIALENLGMNGRVSLHALSRLTTDGLVNRPDIVMINFGINDALQSLGLATYVEALESSVKLVKASGADVILLGPSTTLRGDGMGELALTRPYAGAMEEVAARLGVFYFDLGSVTMAAPGTPAGTGAEQSLKAIREAYLSYFEHGAGVDDTIHPSPPVHQRMGDALFGALRDGAPDPGYRLHGVVTLEGDGRATLEFKIKNLQEVPVEGQIFLMPAAGLEPEQESVAFDLAAGKGKVFRMGYRLPAAADGGFDFPADAPRIFAPILVSDQLHTSSWVIAAPLAPLGVVWDSGAQDLSRSGFEIKCDVVGFGAAPAAGSYEAQWNGQRVKGSYQVSPGEKQTLALAFEVPPAGGLFRVRDKLVLSLESGGKRLNFVRNLEASRNLGLGETVDLMLPSRYTSGARETDGHVKFMAEATARQLVLNFDVQGIALEQVEGQSALMLEFQLDARGYGKRRKFGYVDSVRVRFQADGVAERFSELRPAVFGDWYDRALDNEELQAMRTLLPDGRARYSITLPRSYLYLHEFALGNGNSMLGVNANLYFAKAGNPADPYPADRHYALVESGLSQFAAESLSVLELVEKSTGRWSVRLD